MENKSRWGKGKYQRTQGGVSPSSVLFCKIRARNTKGRLKDQERDYQRMLAHASYRLKINSRLVIARFGCLLYIKPYRLLYRSFCTKCGSRTSHPLYTGAYNIGWGWLHACLVLASVGFTTARVSSASAFERRNWKTSGLFSAGPLLLRMI